MSDRERDSGERVGLVLTHPVWSRRAVVGLLAVAVALVAVWWAVDTLWLSDPLTADVAGLEAFVEARTPAVVSVARVLTHSGDGWVMAAAGAVLALIARWRAGGWDPAVLAATVFVGELLVTTVVKASTYRVRPEEALIEEVSFAFPSGHAARAAAVYVLLGWVGWKLARSLVLRVSLAGLSVVMALAVGLSRLVLGVHWPTDVLAGWLLGGLWTVAALTITRPRTRAERPDAEP